jgi:hypothetical protein
MSEETSEQKLERMKLDARYFLRDTWRRISATGIEPHPGLPEDPNDPDRYQVTVCRLWLRIHAVPTSTIRRHTTSYGYKIVIQDWTTFDWSAHKHSQSWRGGYLYISNGAVITAALLEGYSVVRCSTGHFEAFFNLGIRRPGEAVNTNTVLT